MSQFSRQFKAEYSSYQFDDFTLDLERGALFRDGEEIRLRPKTFDLLVYLVLRNGKLVSKRQMLEAIWGDVVVTRDSVSQCVKEIRKALDDGSHSMLRTVPRRGYLFEASVHPDPDHRQTNSSVGVAKQDSKPGIQQFVFGFSVLFGGLLVYWLLVQWSAQKNADALPATVFSNAIAVLPFEDISATQDQEYIGRGIAEEIISYLATRTDLRVVAVTSSFSLGNAGMDTALLGQELNAEHILKGSVRTDGEQIRVTVKLIEVSSGVHRWSEIYDHEVNDLFLIQAEIARAVAEAVDARLSPDPERRTQLDSGAYIKYLRARQMIEEIALGPMPAAEDLLKDVLSQAPDFAPAWSALVDALLARSQHEEALIAAQNALKIEPENAVVMSQISLILSGKSGQLPSATEYANQALVRAPGDARVLVNTAIVAHALGRFDGAIMLLQRVVHLDPLCRNCRYRLARTLLNSGQTDEAQEMLQIVMQTYTSEAGGGEHSLGVALLIHGKPAEAMKAFLQRPSHDEWVLQGRALSLHDLGLVEASAAALKELEENWGGRAPIVIAQAHAYLGHLDNAIRWLQIELQRNYYMLPHHLRSPLFRNVRDHPRWQEVLEEVGLSDMQLADIPLHIPEFH